MKVLVIGANGTIGRLITQEFKKQHEVIAAGRSDGDLTVDIAKPESIEALFEAVGKIDACVCVAGDSETSVIGELTEDQLMTGIDGKVLAQINLVRIGHRYLSDRGSFTLTSGKMGDKPVAGNAGKAFVNGAINSFVLAAALDLKRGLRINAVSPAKIGSALDADVIDAYRRSVEGSETGQVFRIY